MFTFFLNQPETPRLKPLLRSFNLCVSSGSSSSAMLKHGSPWTWSSSLGKSPGARAVSLELPPDQVLSWWTPPANSKFSPEQKIDFRKMFEHFPLFCLFFLWESKWSLGGSMYLKDSWSHHEARFGRLGLPAFKTEEIGSCFWCLSAF